MIGFYPRFRTLFKFVVFSFRQFQFVAWFSLLFKVPLRRTRKLLHLKWWGGRKEKWLHPFPTSNYCSVFVFSIQHPFAIMCSSEVLRDLATIRTYDVIHNGGLHGWLLCQPDHTWISCPKTCDVKIKENVFKVTKKRTKQRGTAVMG